MTESDQSLEPPIATINPKITASTTTPTMTSAVIPMRATLHIAVWRRREGRLNGRSGSSTPTSAMRAGKK